MSDLTPPAAPTDEPPATPAATPPTRPRARLIALIASGAAVLVVIAIVIAFLVVPRGEPVALVDEETPKAAASAAPTATATPTPTITPTPAGAVPAPAPAPAPANPAPANPAPANPAPVLPAPPAPVIPALKIDAMNATATTACGPQGHILITWSASGALANSATMNVRSGGGTPIFNQNWDGYDPVDHLELLTVDCTRPLWYFTLTVSNGTASKTARLTFANGQNVGWSSVAP